MNNPPLEIPLRLCGHPGRSVGHYPVQIGVPFPRACLHSTSDLTLRSSEGRKVPADITEVMRWTDGSLRWILLRFVSTGVEGIQPYHLVIGSSPRDPGTPELEITENREEYVIATGPAKFTVSRKWLHPLVQVEVEGRKVLDPISHNAMPVLLTDIKGKEFGFQIEQSEFEHRGCVAAVILQRGSFVDRRRRTLCRGECRLSFWAGTALVRIEFTLWNPRAAKHKGGRWDLGDPGSVFFRSVHFPFRFGGEGSASWTLTAEPGIEPIRSTKEQLSIHQSSSGGPNWSSLAHVDKDNIPTPKFKGYRLFQGSSMSEGLKANPAVVYRDSGACAAFAIEEFWQRFPNRLEVSKGVVSVEPFPAADEQDFELQGGEQATFRIWADYHAHAAENAALWPARLRLIPALSPEWYRNCGNFSHLVSDIGVEDSFFQELMASCVEGQNSFFVRRDVFEELGCRNFGEVAADHESLHYKGTREFVSHYNNQYDMVLGFLARFASTGDPRWFHLGLDLARHVIDHDLYHTQRDKAAYNGGYFWHTAHYLHAGTATHRSYSKRANDEGSMPRWFGGGPSNEHNYPSGLALYYLISGDVRAMNAVLQLASWVRDMRDGSRTLMRFISRNETGLATCTGKLGFQGPGRGGAYSVNACLEAYSLVGEKQWLLLAEELIRTCIHPDDDPDKMDLLNREAHWSYVVFLQILGKYLLLKRENQQLDEMFAYARESLLSYARWMLRAEYPYLDKPVELEYPTSTWATHEFRKANALYFASECAKVEEGELFKNKALFFERRGREYLESAVDKACARNVATLLATLPGCFAFGTHGKSDGPECTANWRSIQKRRIIPQKIEVFRLARKIPLLRKFVPII